MKLVGAIMDRPPKNGVFRILIREITVFLPYGNGFCLGKIRGRPLVAPTAAFFDTRKGDPLALSPEGERGRLDRERDEDVQRAAEDP